MRTVTNNRSEKVFRWPSRIVIVTCAACATSPTGRKQLRLLPESQMSQMGVTAFAEMKREIPIDSNPQRNALVQCVADSIVAALPDARDRTGWEVVVFDDKTANAFALPGKKIGVHSGMLAVARTPSELSAVVGHEIAHVLAGHANERVSSSLLAESGLVLIGRLTSGREEDSNQRRLILGLIGLGAEVGILLPYSRAHEREADRIGLDLMARAGFDPHEAVDLWRAMERRGGPQPPEFLSTHPSHGSRIQDLSSRLVHAVALYEDARSMGKRPACARWTPVALSNPEPESKQQETDQRGGGAP